MTAQELAQMIWGIKELIRDDYNDKDVDQVIMPFTLLRRLDCVLEDKKKDIEEVEKQLKASIPDEDKLSEYVSDSLRLTKGIPFYNRSKLSLKKMLGNPEELTSNFKTYLDGFSENIKDILYNFTGGKEKGLSPIYETLARKQLLYKVTEAFVQKADLSLQSVDNHMMGTVFETIIRYSKESTNDKAGQYYTPREIIRLLVNLVMCGEERKIYREGHLYTVYDPCCGTGGMLTLAKEYLERQTGRKNVAHLHGQELNEQTYAICKSDLIMKGDDASGIHLGNTLTHDYERGATFDYMLANPPFGMDWKKSEEQIRDEAETSGSRFSPGLPSTSDGSLLFLLHMISKMRPKEGSRIGIVLNGSPLFNGDAGSGWSNIRKFLLDKNLLDLIVALPGDLFYGTGINTYLWILDNKRPEERRGKVLFINANYPKFETLLQHSLGKKRYELSKEGSEEMVELYRNYRDASDDIDGKQTAIAKVIPYEDFEYTKVTVLRPLRLIYRDNSQKIERLIQYISLKKADQSFFNNIANLPDIDSERTDAAFFDKLRKSKVFRKLTALQIKKVRQYLGEIREGAPMVHEDPFDDNSPLVPDPNLTDTENIPLTEDIDTYFQREVLKFVPDAWLDRAKDKIGCEFPFTRLFYTYQPLRSTEEIMADLKALDADSEKDWKALMEEES